MYCRQPVNTATPNENKQPRAIVVYLRQLNMSPSIISVRLRLAWWADLLTQRRQLPTSYRSLTGTEMMEFDRKKTLCTCRRHTLSKDNFRHCLCHTLKASNLLPVKATPHFTLETAPSPVMCKICKSQIKSQSEISNQ